MQEKVLSQFTCRSLGILKNRVVMSPMTRGFSDKNHCCTENISQYYIRRARNDIGLIITEGIIIDPSGDGYNNVPHMSTKKQALSWKNTVKGVHKFNSKIIAQLWHCGRISHPDYTQGLSPVSSTNKAAGGINRQNNKPYGIPKALKANEIDDIISMYVKSTRLALNVGFDAVEIHMGHGYLIDQFFDSRINNRTDNYGGCIENRCRFAVNLISRLLSEFDSNKIIVRISPSRYMGEIYEWPHMDKMLEYLIPKLSNIRLKVLDISCANADFHQTSKKVLKKIKDIGWCGVIISGASLTLEEANYEIENNHLDLVTWGRNILANPDFVTKLKNREELKPMTDDIRNTLY